MSVTPSSVSSLHGHAPATAPHTCTQRKRLLSIVFDLGMSRRTSCFHTGGCQIRQEGWRQRIQKPHGIGDDFVGSWLDLTKLVTSDASQRKSVYPDLAQKLGSDVYVDVNGWHLYLKDISVATDMKLHSAIAQEIAPDLIATGYDEMRIVDVLKRVPLKLGGDKTRVALYDVIPAFALQDFLDICKRYSEEN